MALVKMSEYAVWSKIMKIPFLSGHDKHWREVVEKSFVAFVMKALGAGLGFVFNVLLARMLGADGAGVFFLALTVTTIASVFGRIGLDNTLVRFTAGNAGLGNWSAVKGIYRKGMLLTLVASTAASLVMFLLVPWLAEKVFNKPELTGPNALDGPRRCPAFTSDLAWRNAEGVKADYGLSAGL